MSTSTISGGSEDGRNGSRRNRNRDGRTPNASGSSLQAFEARPAFDCNKRSVRVGDVVSVPARVVEVAEGGVANLKLETLHRIRPMLETSTLFVSSDQVVVVPAGVDEDTAGLVPGASDMMHGGSTANAGPIEGMCATPVSLSGKFAVQPLAYMTAVFYSTRKPGDLPIALFHDHDDAKDWVTQQADRYECKVEDFLLSPLPIGAM